MNCNKVAGFMATLLLLAAPAFAKGGHSSSSHASASSGSKVHVKGYTKKKGTYVKPHDRTAPNGTKQDNWSTKGNTNPDTNTSGTKSPDK